MSVVTLFGQSYCLDRDIGQRVAKTLGYQFVPEQALIEQVARDAGLSESSLQACLRRSFSLFSGGASSRRLHVAQVRVALARLLAQDNLVYCGLASLLVPRTIEHVLRVCLVAETDFRVRRATEVEGVSEGKARSLISRADTELVDWGQFLSLGVKPWEPDLHDILLPVHTTTLEDASDLIRENAKRPAVETTPDSQQHMRDFQLAADVLLELAAKRYDVDATAADGKVTVLLKRYPFRPEAQKRRIEHIAKGVKDVNDVEARIGPKVKTPRAWPPVDIDVPQKVLLVDDEREFVQTLSERLQTRQMAPSIAYDGEEALSLMEKDEPEVMVLDLKMPGIDGIEVLRRVKRDHPRTEVIILTGHGSDRERELALELGAFAYLQKPVDINTLANTMKEAYARVALYKQSDDGVP